MKRKRVIVVGGGISGLATAVHLVEESPELDVVVLEENDRLGGVIATHREDGFLVEEGPENFITNVPWCMDFCRKIGFEQQLIATNDEFRAAFVVRDGELCKIPEGFVIMAPSRLKPILTTPILSWKGKLRLMLEWLVPRKKEETDESLTSFATRRFGREVFERLIQPLVGGIYTADPDQLSLSATMPRFVKMERDHGSLTRAVFKEAAQKKAQKGKSSGARSGVFVGAKAGMSEMVDVIRTRLGESRFRTSAKVTRISKKGDGQFHLDLAGVNSETVQADAVVVATPAYHAANILNEMSAQLSDELNKIPYAGCALVSLGYRREQIGHQLDGFGYVTPQVEDREVLSSSFNSVKYVGRAPNGCELIRVFIGGACQEHLVDSDEKKLLEIAENELHQLLKVEGVPVFTHIVRQRKKMPQYHIGHEDLVKRIGELTDEQDGLFLTGNAYHGVGMPFCVRGGETTAKKVVSFLNDKASD